MSDHAMASIQHRLTSSINSRKHNFDTHNNIIVLYWGVGPLKRKAMTPARAIQFGPGSWKDVVNTFATNIGREGDGEQENQGAGLR